MHSSLLSALWHVAHDILPHLRVTVGELSEGFEEDVAPDGGGKVIDAGEVIDEELDPTGRPGKVIRRSRKLPKSIHEQRFSLSTRLLFVVSLLAAGLLAAAVWGPVDRLDTIQSLAAILFGPLVTLFGTSVAWYYATDKNLAQIDQPQEPPEP